MQGISRAWQRGAAVVLAVSGAVAGVGAGVGAATAGTAHAAQTNGLSGAAETQTLLGYVPSDHRGLCSRQDPAEFADGSFESATAIVKCEHPADGVDGLVYALYADAGQLAAAYQSKIPQGLPVTDGTSTSCPAEATWHYVDATTDAGRDACFVVNDSDGNPVAKVVWTSDASNILGYAFNDEGDGAAVKQWWNDQAGPLAAPEADDGLADLTPAGRTAAAKALIRDLPEAMTKCKARNAKTYATDEPEWAWLPWLGADVLCKVPDKGVVYLAQLAPGTAHDYWNAFRDNLTDEDYGPKHPAVCKEATPLTRRGEQIGEVACWYYHQALWAAWYDETTGIVGGASVSKTPQQLLDYVQHDLA